MRTNDKYMIGLASLLLLGVTSCSLPTDYDASIERDVDATIQYKEDASGHHIMANSYCMVCGTPITFGTRCSKCQKQSKNISERIMR